MTEKERLAVRNECKQFILNDENLSKKFNLCSEEDQEWVLDYLSSGKGTIPYEMITRYDLSTFHLKKAIFSFPTIFILVLKMM